FGRVRFPILPTPIRQPPRTRGERLRQQILGRPTRRAYSGLWRARHPTLAVPRDFDLSPYFDVVKFNSREPIRFEHVRADDVEAPNAVIHPHPRPSSEENTRNKL
ncbi:MAG TPA: hypothetical protein VKJ00_13765, partial [Thermoanaerobaculia bacterium]|nr:hypothetical protein [Thermoanaerobaculia bacterium]